MNSLTKFILTAIVFILFILILGVEVRAQIGCGIPPLPPIGCSGRPQCICTANGCVWIWNCR